MSNGGVVLSPTLSFRLDLGHQLVETGRFTLRGGHGPAAVAFGFKPGPFGLGLAFECPLPLVGSCVVDVCFPFGPRVHHFQELGLGLNRGIHGSHGDVVDDEAEFLFGERGRQAADQDVAEPISSVDVDEVDTAAADGVGDQGFDQGSQPGTRFRFAEQEPVDGINVVVDGDLKIEDVAVPGEELGLVGRVDVSEETGCGVSVEFRSCLLYTSPSPRD